jgi:hypothetical protein
LRPDRCPTHADSRTHQPARINLAEIDGTRASHSTCHSRDLKLH